MMLAAIVATFGFIMLASKTGMPISGTHAIVAAIFGVGIAAGGKIDYFGKHGILYILEGWLLSPILAMLCAFLIFSSIGYFSLNTKNSYAFRIHGTSLCVGIVGMGLLNILDR